MCLMWQSIRSGVRYNPLKTTMVESKSLTLKNVERVLFRFDPFFPQNDSLRNFMPLIMLERVRQTNPNCVVKAYLTNDRTPPTFRASLCKFFVFGLMLIVR
ncbi:unnamed protein product [Soboliphyme baturini]|uniref:Large ribosomal subunit protein mL53 n=1 Tax=Soboliphyme baturini TaxID=241478 RepID=A0A183IGR4_9BILA|nr:unnamed protein product [Soboliphyme baturini]